MENLTPKLMDKQVLKKYLIVSTSFLFTTLLISQSYAQPPVWDRMGSGSYR